MANPGENNVSGEGLISGEVVIVDRFGNLITNISVPVVSVKLAESGLNRPPSCEPMAMANPARLVALIGSSGRLEIAVVNGSAAAQLNLGWGRPSKSDRGQVDRDPCFAADRPVQKATTRQNTADPVPISALEDGNVPAAAIWLVSRLLILVGLSAPIAGPGQGQSDKDATGDKAADKATERPRRPPGDKVEFKWKFEKDKPFYQEMTTKTQQDMKVMGMDVKQTQDQTFYFSLDVQGGGQGQEHGRRPEDRGREADASTSPATRSRSTRPIRRRRPTRWPTSSRPWSAPSSSSRSTRT